MVQIVKGMPLSLLYRHPDAIAQSPEASFFFFLFFLNPNIHFCLLTF